MVLILAATDLPLERTAGVLPYAILCQAFNRPHFLCMLTEGVGGMCTLALEENIGLAALAVVQPAAEKNRENTQRISFMQASKSAEDEDAVFTSMCKLLSSLLRTPAAGACQNYHKSRTDSLESCKIAPFLTSWHSASVGQTSSKQP